MISAVEFSTREFASQSLYSWSSFHDFSPGKRRAIHTMTVFLKGYPVNRKLTLPLLDTWPTSVFGGLMDKGFSREHVQSKNRCGEEKLCFSMRSISARSGSKDVWVYFQFLKISPELNIFYTNQNCIFFDKVHVIHDFLVLITPLYWPHDILTLWSAWPSCPSWSCEIYDFGLPNLK